MNTHAYFNSIHILIFTYNLIIFKNYCAISRLIFNILSIKNFNLYILPDKIYKKKNSVLLGLNAIKLLHFSFFAKYLCKNPIFKRLANAEKKQKLNLKYQFKSISIKGG